MKEIKLLPRVGIFAENKDIARSLRIGEIIPVLDKEEEITLNFAGVGSATQSFIHALLSDIIRRYGAEILDKIYFKNCNPTIKELVNIVVDYMQEVD